MPVVCLAHLLREQLLVSPEEDARPGTLRDAPVVSVMPVLSEGGREEQALFHLRIRRVVVV